MQETSVVVDDEVEKSPETLNAEPESQLNHTNLFVKNNLNEAEEIDHRYCQYLCLCRKEET